MFCSIIICHLTVKPVLLPVTVCAIIRCAPSGPTRSAAVDLLWRPVNVLWRPVDVMWRSVDVMWRPVDMMRRPVDVM